jgi:signal transduction histidine kinase
MFLIAAGFLLAYVSVYNKRKRRHSEEKQSMQHTFTQQLLQSRLEMQEHTFKMVSEEIHDNVGQILSLASIQLSMAIGKMDTSEVTLKGIKENVDNALNDLRNIAKNLNGNHLQQLSLLQFLNRAEDQITRNGFIHCHKHIKGEEKEICLQNKFILFRILQECFQNVIKHADASAIKIEVKYDHDGLKLIFNDNGKGFDMEHQTHHQPSTGLGLANMQNRVALINGVININSLPNQGTTIHISIPYEQ